MVWTKNKTIHVHIQTTVEKNTRGSVRSTFNIPQNSSKMYKEMLLQRVKNSDWWLSVVPPGNSHDEDQDKESPWHSSQVAYELMMTCSCPILHFMFPLTAVLHLFWSHFALCITKMIVMMCGILGKLRYHWRMRIWLGFAWWLHEEMECL